MRDTGCGVVMCDGLEEIKGLRKGEGGGMVELTYGKCGEIGCG
jgi:hypothetical protein